MFVLLIKILYFFERKLISFNIRKKEIKFFFIVYINEIKRIIMDENYYLFICFIGENYLFLCICIVLEY